MTTADPKNTTNDGPLEPAVVKSVEISASTYDVWRALTDPGLIQQWMGGTRVESRWELGSEISFAGTMPNFNKSYHDRGTVLAIEREQLLRYSHWSEMSRLPDVPENRTMITFILNKKDKKIVLTVRHEGFHSEPEYKHAHFFWGFALRNLKNVVEPSAGNFDASPKQNA